MKQPKTNQEIQKFKKYTNTKQNNTQKITINLGDLGFSWKRSIIGTSTTIKTTLLTLLINLHGILDMYHLSAFLPTKTQTQKHKPKTNGTCFMAPQDQSIGRKQQKQKGGRAFIKQTFLTGDEKTNSHLHVVPVVNASHGFLEGLERMESRGG